MLATATGVADTTVDAALTALENAATALHDLNFEALSNPERVIVLQRLETVARMIPSVGHTLIAQIQQQWVYRELGNGNLTWVLADALRITPGDARLRTHLADELGPRQTITGQPLDPIYTETAAGQKAGQIGDPHIKVIREFFKNLPHTIDIDTREQAEAALATLARTLRPDELRAAANRMLAHLNPDGTLTDEKDRARRRSFDLGKQGPDKMTKGSFCADPELRAYLEAVFAKWAKPGMCNPDDDAPIVDGDPTDDVAKRDTRTTGQRQHDALKAMSRAMLASGDLGQHRGLPVTVVVTMTLTELQDATGNATTHTGSLLPMRDAIRVAAHAHHYLAIFDDDGRPLYLGRSERLAQPDQRIVIFAQHKGCTFPGCSRPASHCDCHHCREWEAQHGLTNVDELTFACPIHHPLVGVNDTDWETIVAPPGHRYPGRTLWIPPKHIDPQQKPRINHYHHPGEYLLEGIDDDEPRKP
ncbi:HNH endonuclease signature motif containing protein [Antrihabitans stalactiti]|uniref:HNH endonuclease n=1 Tax=Antrihabitans stalactiti TaxID=2584121 RepID=A0A848KKR5_9NOCA|nr:HNH endonuclease signature motif containing protein [Antrihabitans stalactiti]NMN99275.1 HNH endonuclease [Antrihabitans stalactiti]